MPSTSSECCSTTSESFVMSTLTLISILIVIFLLIMMLTLHFRTWRTAKEANAWIQLYLFSNPTGVSVIPNDMGPLRADGSINESGKLPSNVNST